MQHKYYIENLGSQTLGDEIMALNLDGGANITEHHDMECLDRSGKTIKRNLYEVPAEVRDKIIRMKAGFQFAIYRQVRDSLPREYYTVMVPVRPQVFRHIPRHGHRVRAVMPPGVLTGSNLFGRV
jgi:hypothetical protein